MIGIREFGHDLITMGAYGIVTSYIPEAFEAEETYKQRHISHVWLDTIIRDTIGR